MKTFRFMCEVLTPLFLGGADPRHGPPELRVPSLRGAMRYWYRALVGGSNLMTSVESVEEEIANLTSEEGRVFGTTEAGSAVSIVISTRAKPVVETYQKDRAIRTPDGDFLPTGKDYLLWSMAASGRPDTPKYQPARQYIRPGSKFEVIVRSKGDTDFARRAIAAFWLLANLGAFGSRANRGAGSIQASTLDSVQDEVIAFRANPSVDALRSYLEGGLRRCLGIVGGQTAQWRNFAGGDLPLYDLIAPSSVEVWIIASEPAGWNSPIAALNGVGEKLRDYRSHRYPLGRADHDAVLHWLEKGGPGPEIKRTVFGLPIPFRYSEGGPFDVIQAEGSDRRSSPLHIHITRLSTGKYVGVLVLFKSEFLKEGTNLQLQTRRGWTAPPPSNYRVIEDFIKTFSVRQRVNL